MLYKVQWTYAKDGNFVTKASVGENSSPSMTGTWKVANAKVELTFKTPREKAGIVDSARVVDICDFQVTLRQVNAKDSESDNVFKKVKY